MYNSLPVMLLKGLVLLPNQEVKLDINNKISKKIVMLSSKNYDDEIMIVCPKDQKEEVPEITDLPFVGVICKITSKIELPNGHLKIKVCGKERVSIEEYSNNVEDSDILECSFTTIVLPKFNEVESIAIKRKLLEVLKKYIDLSPSVSNSILTRAKEEEDLYKLTDQITLFLPLSIEKKLDYMEEINAIKRAQQLIKDLSIEIEVILLEDKIEESVSLELENNQKEFILKEKLKQIKKELGEEDAKDAEVSNYFELLEALDISPSSKEKICSEIKKYAFTSEMSPDASLLRNYLEWIFDLPWNTIKEEETNIQNIQKALDKSHYGLTEIKERIIEYIAIKKRNPEINSPILCLVGPPGVGKTTLAFSIAEALNKTFSKISVGGLNDSAELNGHRRTYIGSSPGKIIQSIKKCGNKNPLLLIDEVDKMVKDYKGDPASTLLDILDKEQNKMFVDNYIEEPFDLSQVFFILTANEKENIPVELLDRLEIMEISSYTEWEKIDIAKKYILPKLLKEHHLKTKDIKFSDEILKTIILNYTKEAGVRELERVIYKMIRKIIVQNDTKEEIKYTVKSQDLYDFLGPFKYENLQLKKLPASGVINGLAYTPYGGKVMPIESVMYEGCGKIECTGSLGEVLKESVKVAMSYIKAYKDELKINDYYFQNNNFHIHALDGATKKEGPSAGVALTTSLISLILNKKVNSDIAMTGEISLHGEILEVGGIKEKIISAYNNHIKIIFIPKKNHKDLNLIPEEIIKDLTIIEVSRFIEVYDHIFG